MSQVSDIVQQARSDFSLAVKIDTSRIQDLFEHLCISVLSLQKEIADLREQMDKKADKEEIVGMNNSIQKNEDVCYDLTIQLDALRSDVRRVESAPKVVERVVTEGSKLPQLEIPVNSPEMTREEVAQMNKEIEDLKKRVGTCERGITDCKSASNELKTCVGEHAKSIANMVPPDFERTQRLNDLLDDLEGTKDVPPVAISKSSSRGSIVSPKVASTRSVHKTPPVTPKAVESPKEPTPRKVDHPSQEEDEKKQSTIAANAEELLETFMDAARVEINNSKREAIKDSTTQIKDATTQLSGTMSKIQTNMEISNKKLSSLIQESDAKQSANITRVEDTANQLKFNVSAMMQRIDALEGRIATLQKGADKNTIKNVVKEDGKVDMTLLLNQIQAQMSYTDDLGARLTSMEKREVVSPEQFQTLMDTLTKVAGKAAQVEQATVICDLKITDLTESQRDIKAMASKQVSIEFVDEVRSIAHETIKDVKELREQVDKCQKDIFNARAAINTLRQHSEETRSTSDETAKLAEAIKDDMSATDKRVKKVIAFIQGETTELANKIKELQVTLERNEDLIEEVKTARSNAMSSRFDIPIEKALSPASKSTRNEATSPHLPTPPVDTVVPVPAKPEPHTEAAPVGIQELCEPPPTVITLPEKIIYEQPVVTVVKKRNIEVVETVAAKRGRALPRLSSSQGRRSEPEVTRSDIKRFEELIPRMRDAEQGIQSLKQAIDQLNKSIKSLADAKADKTELQQMFDQFKMAMGELNQRLGSLRKAVLTKAEQTELVEVQRTLMREVIATGETAAGTESVRCLTCGKPRSGVVGSSDETRVTRSVMSSRVSTAADGSGSTCFVYGEHGEMYVGRSQDGRPLFQKKEKEASTQQGGPAPAPSRKVIDGS